MAKSRMPNIQDVAARAMKSIKGGYGGDDEDKKKGKGKAKGAARARPARGRTARTTESARTP